MGQVTFPFSENMLTDLGFDSKSEFRVKKSEFRVKKVSIELTKASFELTKASIELTILAYLFECSE